MLRTYHVFDEQIFELAAPVKKGDCSLTLYSPYSRPFKIILMTTLGFEMRLKSPQCILHNRHFKTFNVLVHL
jgi:hypothetical protein